MKRRNFLKLFGLLAVPSSVLALPNKEQLPWPDITYENFFGCEVRKGKSRAIINGNEDSFVADWTDKGTKWGVRVRRTDTVVIQSGGYMNITTKDSDDPKWIWIMLERA